MHATSMAGRARSAARVLTLLVACTLGLGLAAAGTASAQTYPSVASLTTDKPTVTPCQTVTLTGAGFLPNHLITITVNGQVAGTVMSDAQGNFTFPYPVPCNAAAGQLLFTASDGTTTLSASVSVSGTSTGGGGNAAASSGSSGATGTTSGGTLPVSGSNTDTYVRIAVLLIALGGIVLLATRRRDRSSAAA